MGPTWENGKGEVHQVPGAQGRAENGLRKRERKGHRMRNFRKEVREVKEE